MLFWTETKQNDSFSNKRQKLIFQNEFLKKVKEIWSLYKFIRVSYYNVNLKLSAK